MTPVQEKKQYPKESFAEKLIGQVDLWSGSATRERGRGCETKEAIGEGCGEW